MAVRRCAAPDVAPSPVAAAWLAARRDAPWQAALTDEPWPAVPPDEPWPVVLTDGPWPVVLLVGPWLVVLLAALRLALAVLHPVRVRGVPGPARSSSASRRQPKQPSGKRHAEA